MSDDFFSSAETLISSPIGVVVADSSMQISDVNEGLCAMLGWRPEELIGQGVDKLIAPEDLAACQQALSPLLSGEAEVTSFSKDCVHRAGYAVPVEVTSTLRRDPDGQPMGVLCHLVDVTAKQRAERELQRERDFTSAVVDTAGALIIVMDSGGRIVRFNAACERLTGYLQHEVIGRHFFDFLLAPDDMEPVKAVFGELSSGHFPNTHENEWVARDGSRRTIAWRNTALLAPDGRVEHVIGTGIDVTDQRLLEQRVRQSEKLEAIGQLAGGVAHDFNNLLAAIMGAADLLAARLTTDGDESRLASQVLSASRRAADLTGKLLAFSRRGDVERVQIDMHETIDEICALLRRTINPRVFVEVRRQAANATVTGDRAQIDSMLLNLALNARDAMPEGGLLLFTTRVAEISSAEAESLGEHVGAGRFVVVGVRDQGVGMSPEVLARAFEPFFTTKEPGKGTGLGLSAAHGTMAAHSGAIQVNSSPGGGTLVQLWLPLSEGAPASTDAAAPTAAKAVTGHILVVDDEPVVRMVVSEMLTLLGHSVTEATCGQEAVELCAKATTPFDAIVLDMVMPGLDGKATMAQLLALDPDARIVICTGFNPGDAHVDEAGCGPRAILRKPFEMDRLRSTLESVLSERSPD